MRARLSSFNCFSSIDDGFMELNCVKVVMPEHNYRIGNPVILPRNYFKTLKSLKDDFGARSLIRKKDVKGLKGENKLNDRSVSITIDDAYLSVYTKAWPILKKLNLPFTLFIATDVIDNNFSNYMNWDQIRELVDNGVLIGSQTKSHPHMHRLSSKQILNEIEFSNKRFIEELGFKPKLFAIAGYDKNQVNEKFSGMINALSYGAPPHGGIAPGIDRIIMLLANEKNIREVTMFPMNQNAQDLMMNAPSSIDEKQLKELNLALKIKK